MGIDHGRTNILVTEQFLHGANVIAILKEMSSKAMPQGMAGDAFSNGGVPRSFFYSPLEAGRVDMVTALFAAT